MINATKDWYVPGMSVEAMIEIYPDGYTFDQTGYCTPHEDVMFNDEQIFLKRHLYPVKEGDHRFEILCLDSERFYKGLIVLNLEQFLRWFSKVDRRL